MGLFIDLLRIVGIVIWLVVFLVLSDGSFSPMTAKVLIIAGIALNLLVMALERRRRDYY